MMKCEEVQQWLRRDLDGVAEPSVEVAAHLERCRACAAEARRLKALAEKSREALPAAEVPADFTDQVMTSLVEPTADEALATAARPRVRRWLPVLAALLIIPLVPLLGARPAATGALRVERDGAWVEADRAARDHLFGLDTYAHARVGATGVTALEPSLLRASDPLELLGGQVHVDARDSIVVKTPLAEIRLHADSACVATLGKEKEMSFDNLKRLGPTLLTVTLLAGGATVANAQGEEKAEKDKPVTVAPGGKPEARNPEATKALEEANRLLEAARAAMDLARVKQQLQVREEDLTRQLAEVRRILQQARRELERLQPQVDKLRDAKGVHRVETLREGQRQVVRRDPRTGEVIEVLVLDDQGVPRTRWKAGERPAAESGDRPFDGPAAEPAPGAGLEQLLRRARRGDREAKSELRRLLQEIEAVVADEAEPPPDERRLTALAEQEVARLREAIDETRDHLRRDDVDLDAEIQRRSRLQARLMRIVELLDASRDQAELAELYARRGRTKEADEAARRHRDLRAELAEVLRREGAR
jgi:hypothetical protein